MRAILAAGEPLDGLFVASDLMARGAMQVLAAEGIRIPDEVAVMGFDDSPVALTTEPQLTTMRQPSFTQGECMADVLLARLAGMSPPEVTILDTELIVRGSA
jgi:DNA-binding LacI/PurR family transcriptional regulator